MAGLVSSQRLQPTRTVCQQFWSQGLLLRRTCHFLP